MTETKKRVMTPELKAKLCGLLPVSKEFGVPFTPDFFSAEELEPFRPVFYQRSWTEDEKNSLMSKSTDDGGDKFDQNLMIEMARVTVVKWENVWDIGAEKKIDFVKDEQKACVSKDLFTGLPFKTQLSLYYNAQKLSGMGGENEELEKESLGS